MKPSIIISFLLTLSLCSTLPVDEYEQDHGAVHPSFSSSSLISSRYGRSDSFCNCTSLFQCDVSGGSGGSTSSGILGGSSKPTSSEEEGGGGGDVREIEEDEDDGAKLEVINIRNGMTQCKHYLEICCNLYEQTPKPNQRKKPPPASGSGGRPDITDSGSFPNPAGVSSTDKRADVRQCGRRNINGVGFRIVGNIEGEAQMGEFPWMIAVTELSKDREGTVYLCGGSLIHPRVVLTAAHCVENKDTQTLRIRAGEWDTQTEREEPYVHYDRQVDRIIIHESYTKRTVLKNDIALILLTREVPLARHIGTVCLSNSITTIPSSQRCFASGWGKNLYGKEGSYQSILKKINLPIVQKDECQSILRTTSLGPRFRLHPSFICAGGERGKDTCKGDGGSPLVCQIPGSDKYALYGIVSWGLNCGDPIPGVYVNVPHFIPWINEKMGSMGLDTQFYEEN